MSPAISVAEKPGLRQKRFQDAIQNVGQMLKTGDELGDKDVAFEQIGPSIHLDQSSTQHLTDDTALKPTRNSPPQSQSQHLSENVSSTPSQPKRSILHVQTRAADVEMAQPNKESKLKINLFRQHWQEEKRDTEFDMTVTAETSCRPEMCTDGRGMVSYLDAILGQSSKEMVNQAQDQFIVNLIFCI
jgi:hypothetical protein